MHEYLLLISISVIALILAIIILAKHHSSEKFTEYKDITGNWTLITWFLDDGSPLHVLNVKIEKAEDYSEKNKRWIMRRKDSKGNLVELNNGTNLTPQINYIRYDDINGYTYYDGDNKMNMYGSDDSDIQLNNDNKYQTFILRKMKIIC